MPSAAAPSGVPEPARPTRVGSLAGALSDRLPGHLAENVMHFARVLRTAGMPVGTDRVQLALAALRLGGLESRRDFHAALSACLVDRAEHRALFDQAFHIFWKNPDLEGRMRALLLPKVDAPAAVPPPENRRLGDALFPHAPNQPSPPAEPPQELQIDAALTFSEREVLRRQDFDTLSAQEWREAQRLLAELAAVTEPVRTRRQHRATRPGRPDWRASLQAMARSGGELWAMRWRAPVQRPAPLVVLADISGSMSRYSRMLLHFTHALAQGDARVAAFVFGTRLTPVTRAMRQRDPDEAVRRVCRDVQDWAGGTRISASLHAFNRHWARRVLGGGATVLLVSDGLEHGDTAALSFEAERLRKSCRRLVWVNPLLRFDAFEPRASGIRALRPQVDDFLPCHNLDTLADLARVLATPRRGPRREPAPLPAL